MIELLLADFSVIVGVDDFDEVLHGILLDGSVVFLVVDAVEHGLNVIEGQEIVVVGIKLIEVFVGELLSLQQLLLPVRLGLGGQGQVFLVARLGYSPLPRPIAGLVLAEPLVAATASHQSLL